MRLLPFVLLFLAFQASAEDSEPRAEWMAPCKFEGTDFSIRFNSKSGDAYQDDQTVTLIWGDNKATVLPVEPALFVPIRFASDTKNYCQGVGAFNWPDGRLLILIRKNDRPSDDQILAIVIDARTGAFVQNSGVLGATWPDLSLLLRQGRGYRVLLERSWHVDPSDGSEFSATDWMTLREDRGRLVHEWEFERK
jgi:hypothetical protein